MKPYTLPTLEEYDLFLSTAPRVTPQARKTFRSGYRRLLRDLHPVECLDPLTLHDYRLSMKLGTRNVFNVTWVHFQALEASRGVVLPDFRRLLRVRFSHPLMHDLLTLTGHMGTEQIATSTWATVPTFAQTDQVERALERIFEFQTGRSSLDVTGDTPLVPTRHGLPMRSWQIEHMLNGPHHETDHPVDRGARALAEALVYAGVNGLMLREYLTLYWQARGSLARGDGGERLAGLLAHVKGRQFGALRTDLEARADRDVEPCW